MVTSNVDSFGKLSHSASAIITSKARSEMHSGELTVDSLGKLSQLGLRLHGLHSSQVAAWRQPQEARYLQQQNKISFLSEQVRYTLTELREKLDHQHVYFHLSKERRETLEVIFFLHFLPLFAPAGFWPEARTAL
jgi:hypothetical protein